MPCNALESRRKIQGYKIVELLGKSNGHVYGAKQRDGPDKALKRVFLDGDAGSAEKRALRILSRLPNTAHLVSVDRWFSEAIRE